MPAKLIGRRGRPTTGDKRRRILDAALKTFAARGYHGTAVPDVAHEARVATGTLYHYFDSKEQLVNAVFVDAKKRLRAALLDQMETADTYDFAAGEKWFKELWRRLAAFARAEPEAFKFLEMQDHTPYLDAESRAVELGMLAPLARAAMRLRTGRGGPPVDLTIALLWGAFVGIVKAERLHYLKLDDKKLAQAAELAWRMIAPVKG
jgi:AcrR family transcriptional regulator